jgi:hypothetical protein
MTREKMKSIFTVHTNGQDEYIKVPKRTYDKMIDMFCNEHEAEIEKVCEILEGANLIAIDRHIAEINTKDVIIKQRIEMLKGANKALDELFKECKLKDRRIAELEEELNLLKSEAKDKRMEEYNNPNTRW